MCSPTERLPSAGCTDGILMPEPAVAGRDVAGRNTNTPGTASSANTSRYARRKRLAVTRRPRSSDDEDRGEDADPDHVDEVPVVGEDLDARVFLSRVRAGRRPA